MQNNPPSPLPTAPQTLWRRIVTRPWVLTFFVAVVVGLALLVGLAIGLIVVNENGHGDGAKASDPRIPRANLGYATYRGTLVGDRRDVAQYLGMRYARAPVGDLRFRKPLDPEVRQGREVKADAFGPACLGISAPYPNDAQDEDCLYANVWAPANATVESKLPVWLFIQGGGYTVNANANWNGIQVVQHSGNSIIFVSFNYRVGLWGFLASERVRADGDLNVGLLDQRLMMRWVRRHIAQFGGDPDHVVIHGASAGAGSVALHLLAHGGNATDPESGEKLFAGAVGESVFFPAQPFLDELEWQFDLVLQRTGCDDKNKEAIACLRGLSTEVLQAANFPAPFPGGPDMPIDLFFWTPCIDGELLRDLPYTLFEKGQFINVPVMMGGTTDEGTVFAVNAATQDEMVKFLQSNYPRLSEFNTSAILERYPQLDSLPNHNIWFPSTARAYGETTFICPGAHILNSYVRHLNSSKAWGYRYDVHDDDLIAAGLGVPHVFSSWAILGPESESGPMGGPRSYYTYNAGVVPIMMDYWISFVRTLDPSRTRYMDTPVWQSWGQADRRLLVQTGNVSIELMPDDQGDRCAFWGTLAPIMRQ
ncbi:carboxylesterase [Xylaria bambusicola]|uniref:carboxylesterase n=1 Tax=Xylaria bambusicola TaxID=326684 RepID=UPI002008DEAF|nr:carboxylesterase [Xylaria bambusicola]KAI0523870.1 carboxylesterase [Xylaria bambusicola]